MEDYVLKILDETKLQLDTPNLILVAVIAAVTVAVVIALTVINRRLSAKFMDSGELKKAQVYRILFRTATWLVIATVTVAVLQAIGINLTGISAILGIVVVFMLLAAKDALQDVFSGIAITADKYFIVGDAVEYEGHQGIVVAFTPRTTKIELLDDRTVLSVANRNISKIRKLNHLVDVDLPLSYDLSGREALSLLGGICEKIKALDGIEDCELKGTQDFGASAIMYKIRFYCEPHDRPDIRRSVIMTIQDGLEAAGIRIPYQQIDIHEK